MTDPITSERFGNRRIPKMLAQVNAHRAAVAAEGTPLIQDTWDKIEEHIDFAYAKNAAPAVPDDVADLAKRLRAHVSCVADEALAEAADALEAQAAELARLTVAFELVSNQRDRLAAEHPRLTTERDEALGKAALNEEWAADSEIANARLRRALVSLCDAYAACNGEDHPAYLAARAAITHPTGGTPA